MKTDMRIKIYIFLSLLFSATAFCQDGFIFNSNKNKITIPFKYVFNLIIVSVEINDVKLNMLLDSGSEQSVVFSLPENDSIQFKNTKKVFARGLGLDDSIEGLLSQNNTANIGGYSNSNFKLLIILNQDINFSSRLGITVHGILGYSFFLNNIVEINYEKNKINVYKDRKILEKPRIKKYVSLPLKVRGNRPYVEVKTHIGKDSLDLDLLVDVGLSDGLWLFESEKIKCQDEFFEASLGIGFSGEIKGKKSRVNAIEFAGFKLEKPLVSYPYPDYLKKIVISDKRNGSVGNGVLHRFNIFFDNRGKQILLKKNSMFSKDFNYNMSGLTVEHAGIEYVPELVRLSTSNTNSAFNSSGDFKIILC